MPHGWQFALASWFLFGAHTMLPSFMVAASTGAIVVVSNHNRFHRKL